MAVVFPLRLEAGAANGSLPAMMDWTDIDALPPLTEQATETATALLDRTPEQIWDRIRLRPPGEGWGALLEVRKIEDPETGRRAYLERFAFDLVDALILEIQHEVEIGRRYVAELRCVGMQAYNPAERLPQTIMPDLVPNPEREFQRFHGRNQSSRWREITLEPQGWQTEVSVRVAFHAEKQPGWLFRRSLPKQQVREIEMLLAILASDAS